MKKLISSYFDYNTKHLIYNIFGLKIRIKNKQTELFTYIDTVYTLLNNCVDITKVQPATGKLRKVQLECFELLKVVKQVLEQNDLEYWLDSGTLLGAYRHKGFIPWDDDIDICMLRDDYEKARSILKQHFAGTDFVVREKADKCNYFQIRIFDKKNKHIGVDIFPVDYYYKEVVTEQEKIEVNKKIIKAKKIFDKKYSTKYLKPNKIQQALTDLRKIQNKIVLENKQVLNNEQNALFFAIDFYNSNFSPIHSLVVDNKMIFPLKTIVFEGEEFSCPNKVHEYLTNMYGDYMSFPKSSKCIGNGAINIWEK